MLVGFIENSIFANRALDLRIARAVKGVPESAEFDPKLPGECAWVRGIGYGVPEYSTSIDAVMKELKDWRIADVRSAHVGVTARIKYTVELAHIMSETARGTGNSFNLALCAAMVRAKLEKDDSEGFRRPA